MFEINKKKILLIHIIIISYVCRYLNSTCDNGFYKKNNYCYKCPVNCSKCDSFELCTECVIGHSGNTCSEKCNDYCHDNECGINGICLSCIKGYYFENYNDTKFCNKCPNNCYTCNSKFYCFACNGGYYNSICDKRCNCKDYTSCDKQTGYCFTGCIDGFSGELCDIKCNVNNCISCVRNSNSECLKCIAGKYGKKCENDCMNCENGCDIVTGNCIGGCLSGYWGEYCNESCKIYCNTTWCNVTNGDCYVYNDKYYDGKLKPGFKALIGITFISIIISAFVMVYLYFKKKNYSVRIKYINWNEKNNEKIKFQCMYGMIYIIIIDKKNEKNKFDEENEQNIKLQNTENRDVGDGCGDCGKEYTENDVLNTVDRITEVCNDDNNVIIINETT